VYEKFYVDPRIEQARDLYKQGFTKEYIKKELHVGNRYLTEWLSRPTQ